MCCGEIGHGPTGKANTHGKTWSQAGKGSLREGSSTIKRNGRWSPKEGRVREDRVEGRLARFFGWSERAQSRGYPLLLPASLLRPVNMCVKKT